MSFGVVAASHFAVADNTMRVVGIAQGTRVGAGTLVVTPPAGASGYLAIVSGASNSQPPIPPSGWTSIDGGSGSWSTFSLYYANSLPGDTWSGAQDFCVQVVGYSRLLSVPVQYATASWGNGTPFNQPVTCPSLTTTQPSLIARIYFVQPWAATGPYVPVYPTNAPLNQAYIDAPQGGNDCVLNAVAHESQVGAGATGTADWTINMGTQDDHIGVTLILGPLQ